MILNNFQRVMELKVETHSRFADFIAANAKYSICQDSRDLLTVYSRDVEKI